MTRTRDQTPSRAAIVQAQDVNEGNGIVVGRVFPQDGFRFMDPFLLLDHLGPAEVPKGSTTGFPPHPHRGFETITYVLEGELAHKDSEGHEDVIEAGDAQWMTAAGGIIHSEFPGPKLREAGGTMHAVQIWLNLAAMNKMARPRYQALKKEQIPRVELPGGAGTATIIGGKMFDERGPAERLTPATIAVLEIEPDGALLLPIKADWNTALYVIDGQLAVQGLEHQLIARQMLALGHEGGHGQDHLPIVAGPEGATLLFLSGSPLDEPVVSAGPFVMNTEDEIEQAFADYKAGTLGQY